MEEVFATEKDMHRVRKNGIYLSDNEITVLERYQIHYQEYPNAQSLLLRIEEELNENGDDSQDLEAVSEALATFSYYHDTHK